MADQPFVRDVVDAFGDYLYDAGDELEKCIHQHTQQHIDQKTIAKLVDDFVDRVLSSSCLSMFEQEAVCMLGGSSIANASASATVAVPVSTYSGHHENSVDNSLYDLQQQILNKQHMIARAQQLIQIQKQEINAFQQAGTSTAILYSIPVSNVSGPYSASVPSNVCSRLSVVVSKCNRLLEEQYAVRELTQSLNNTNTVTHLHTHSTHTT